MRRGDLVEVKSASEILASLGARGELAELPFMPEMLGFAGRRFVVGQTADKICDTIHYSGSRQLPDTVLLEDLRCDGSAHDGCQAECRLFWKREWLRPVTSGASPATTPTDAEAEAALATVTHANIRDARGANGLSTIRYRCQATQLFAASKPVRIWDPRAYLRELISGNVPPIRFARVMVRALIHEVLRKAGLRSDLPLAPTDRSARAPALGLKEGELVRVKATEDIAKTLNPSGRNRGLWFDREMVPYSGGTYAVRRRIDQFINDQNGEMIRLQSDCLTLEGVVCSGDRSNGRWFCPRAIYPYWREAWLERVTTGAVETIRQKRP